MPQGLQGYFYGLPLATLQALLTSYTSCLTSIAVAGQTYAISGRQFTRANLAEVNQTIMELQAAIDRANGVRTTQVYARMNSGASYPFTSGVRGDLT